MAEPHGQLMRYKKRRRRPSLFLRLRGGRCPGGEQVLRLRARDGAFRAPARVTFFFCKKKVTKENHSNLRFKDPLARGGQVRIWRCVLAGGVQRSSLSVKRTVPAFTGAEASATACLSHGRGVCFYRVGDYQIAPIAARSTAMGRWRLTPPGVWGRRLRARDGAFRAPARVTFFFCKKKVTKENHLDLRSKDPLARYGSCRFGGMHSRMKCSG